MLQLLYYNVTNLMAIILVLKKTITFIARVKAKPLCF